MTIGRAPASDARLKLCFIHWIGQFGWHGGQVDQPSLAIEDAVAIESIEGNLGLRDAA